MIISQNHEWRITMKKALSFILVLAMLTFSLCSCLGSDEGDYDVVIEGYRLATDCDGEPIIIVKYKFTNNEDEPCSFFWAFDVSVYQDGIGLTECLLADDSANYSDEDQYRDIKKGGTLYVEIAYELNDTTTDVEVEVSSLSLFNSSIKASKTFSIK